MSTVVMKPDARTVTKADGLHCWCCEKPAVKLFAATTLKRYPMPVCADCDGFMRCACDHCDRHCICGEDDV